MKIQKGFVVYSRGEPPMYLSPTAGVWGELEGAKVFATERDAGLAVKRSEVAIGYRTYEAAMERRKQR
jgi:hypothetical protein